MATWKFIHESVSMLKASEPADADLTPIEQILGEMKKDARTGQASS